MMKISLFNFTVSSTAEIAGDTLISIVSSALLRSRLLITSDISKGLMTYSHLSSEKLGVLNSWSCLWLSGIPTLIPFIVESKVIPKYIEI